MRSALNSAAGLGFVVLAAVLALHAAPTSAAPVVVNPSFETDVSGWSLWVGAGGNQDGLERQWLVPSGGGADGDWGLVVKGFGAGGKGGYQYIAAGWETNRNYRLSVSCRNIENTGINYSIGYALGNPGAGAGETATYGAPVIHPSSWTAATVEFTYSGAAGVTVYLRAVNDGHSERAGFDFVQIIDLGPAGPTATPTVSPTPSVTPPPGSTATPTLTVTPTFTPVPTPTPSTQLSIHSVTGHGATVGRFEVLTINFGLSQSYSNPFDPLIIDASVSFMGPSGVERFLPAFWTGESPPWRARIAPVETGPHTARLRARDNQGRYAVHDLAFTAVASNNPGFIGRDTRNPFHLRFTTGKPYHPIGHNLCWTIDNPIYPTWLNNMAANGENWSRIWMQSFGQNIEFNSDTEPQYAGLGRYSQIVCNRWDTAVQGMQQRGIYVQMCLDSFTAWNHTLFDEWHVNAYSTALGGPCSIPLELFTNAEALRLYKQRYRYIIARWAASTSVLCWELFNEIDALGAGGPYEYSYLGNRALGATWHRDMARYIRSLDPYAHPITTSMASMGDSFSEVWNLPEMDMVQLHAYSAAIPQTHINMVKNSRQYNKPIIFGEGNAGTWAGPPPGDNGGGTLHIQIWAGAVHETGIMSWWWDGWIHPNGLYYHFDGLAKFMAGEDWAPLNLSPVQFQVLSGPSNPQLYGSASANAAFLWMITYDGTVSNFIVRLPQVTAQTVVADFYNTISGTVFHSQTFHRNGGHMDIAFPSFGWDIAVKIRAPQQPGATFTTW